MDVREKLTHILTSDPEMLKNLNVSTIKLYRLVDKLIAHGVTVQECNVGDTIYEVDAEHGVVKHDVYEICVVFKTTATDDKGNEWDDYWTSEDIKNAFSSRNESELKLLEVLQKG